MAPITVNWCIEFSHCHRINTLVAYYASLHGSLFAIHALLHKTIGKSWWKDCYVGHNGFTTLHKVRGSSPAAALMSFGKTLIYICHTPPR